MYLIISLAVCVCLSLPFVCSLANTHTFFGPGISRFECMWCRSWGLCNFKFVLLFPFYTACCRIEMFEFFVDHLHTHTPICEDICDRNAHYINSFMRCSTLSRSTHRQPIIIVIVINRHRCRRICFEFWLFLTHSPPTLRNDASKYTLSTLTCMHTRTNAHRRENP